MSLPESAKDHYREQQKITMEVLAYAHEVWGSRPPADFDAWFAANVEQLVQIVTVGQLKATQSTDEYVATVLDETGSANVDSDYEIAPEAFAGIASDGRTLEGLMYGAVVAAGKQVEDKGPSSAWLDTGLSTLQMYMQTQLADASRTATQVAISTRDGAGHYRMLNPPSCSRCVLLAGRYYRWNAGFERHPGCDCRAVPADEDVEDFRVDPQKYFESLSRSDQNSIFTHAGAEAIREGADIGQVVNARRGAHGLNTAAGLMGNAERHSLKRQNVYGQQLYTTTEGVTKWGVAGAVIRSRGRDPKTTPRLMPESIFEIAESREDAVRLLRLNGYVLDRSGPATGVGSRKALVPDLDELLNVPLHQLPTVDLDRVIASGRVMSSPPVVRPNPPVQVPTPLDEATPVQVLDTASGLAAFMRMELDARKNPIDRATPLDAVAYDLPEIADSVLQAGINVQPLEYIHKPVTDRAGTTAMLDSIFGMNRSYLRESPHQGVTRPYASRSIESGDRSDALRIAVALKRLDRDDINFTARSNYMRTRGEAEATTLIDEILADGLNVEHLTAVNITPDVDSAIRGRLDELIAAAKVKDTAAFDARKLAEATAAQAEWAENIRKTGAPFKGYLTKYRGTDVQSLSSAKLNDINSELHSQIRARGLSLDDFDLHAVNNAIIEKQLNVGELTGGSFDVLEESAMEDAIWDVLQQHRRTTPVQPAVHQVTLDKRKPRDVKGTEYLDAHTDMLRAADKLGYDADGSDDWAIILDDVLKSGLNTRLITDPAAPDALRKAAQEKFWRILGQEIDDDGIDLYPSTPGTGGLRVAPEPRGTFDISEGAKPEIDDRIGFMERLQFENDFLSVPLAARQILGNTGVRVVASRRVSEGPFASMFDGITSADGRGIDEISFYQNQIKAVVISTDAPHGSVNVVAHEIGHALDSNALKDSPVQVRWQEQGNPNLPPSIVARAQEPTDYTVDRFIDDPYIQWAHKEFIESNPGVHDYYRTGSEGTSMSGREEWIAEGYAALVMNNPGQLAAISGASPEAMDILAWTFRRMGVLP